jgi:type II secretory pathway pseudopilin PulG
VTSRRQKVLIGLAIAFVAVLFMLGFFLGVAVYGWKKAMRAGNETATVQNMETIAAIEAQYFTLHNRRFATIDQLVAEQMMSSKFVGNPPVADGYVLTLKLTGKKTEPGSSYTLNGDPIDDDYGKKHFYLDSSSAGLHVNPDKAAGPNDPLVSNSKN